VIGSSYSLYFHIPFCVRKCPYCHFFVLPESDAGKKELLEGLKLEWERVAPLTASKELVSIYFGGGTPSLMSADAIHEILSWLSPSAYCEITLEANPDRLELSHLSAMQLAGINRLSMGVQSLDDDLLKLLGREHSAQAAIDAIEKVPLSGIHNLSIDLMYEVPHLTIASWEKTLDRIAGLPMVTHLSLYNLTIEPHTAFHKQSAALTPHLPSPEDNLAMLQIAVDRLERMGLKRYEISAFARSGMRSRHNCGYWTGRPFLGLGPSAFSYWEGRRSRNVAHLKKYSDALLAGNSPIDFEEKLSPEASQRELLAVGLRLLEGVAQTTLPDELQKTILTLEKQGYLHCAQEKIYLTEKGILFYDDVAAEIV